MTTDRIPLPTHIGGYQHLGPWVPAANSDILVCDGTPVAFVGDLMVGDTVGCIESTYAGHVYRKMPVVKQSDVHDQQVAADNGALQSLPAVSGNHACLPSDPKARKDTPIATGFIDYFPLAIAEVARVSKAGNDQHNPGTPLHWDRSKSGDESDAMMRHFLERGKLDSDGQRHSAKLCWRAMAYLQKELEAEQ